VGYVYSGGGLMKTDRGIIDYLRNLKPSDVSGEITETEFDRWLNEVCKFTLPATIYYPKTDEFIKLDANGDILDRYPANPVDEEAD
jgi:hypothetical protein